MKEPYKLLAGQYAVVHSVIYIESSTFPHYLSFHVVLYSVSGSFISIKISSNIRYYNVIAQVKRTARTLEVTTTKQHFTKKSKISNFKIPVLRIIRYSFFYFSTRPGTDLLSLYFSNCLTFLISFNNAIRSAVQLDRFETAIVKKCSERKYIAFVTTNEKFSWSLVYGRGGQGISE